MKTKQNKPPAIVTPYFIGCDIVSLINADNIKSYSNEKYINKILNQSELMYYNKSENKQVIPPLFWSCKESVYKILLQSGLKSSFSPRSVNVEINEFEALTGSHGFSVESLTSFENQIFFCRSVVEKDFIFTYACNERQALNNIIFHLEKVQYTTTENICTSTYNSLLYNISQQYKIDYSRLSIKKNEDGEPFIYYNESVLNIPFSVSHDENFISFAFSAIYFASFLKDVNC